MAAAPKFVPADLVSFKGAGQYIVLSVNSELGFNTYELLNIDNGQQETAHTFELTKIKNDILKADDNEMEYQTEEQEQEKRRFKVLNEQQLDELARKRTEATTDKQTVWAVKIFKDWLKERGRSIYFEHLTTDILNELFRQFYGEVQPKKGAQYSRSAYVNIRNGLNRHINSPPYSRKLNIMQDREFGPANQVFTAILKELRREGLDVTKHKPVIPKEDIEKMYESGTLSNQNPVALQRKVFFELSLHYARRGREGLRNLTKSSFEIKTDASGKQFLAMTYNEKEKNHQGLSNREKEKTAAMYEQPDDPERCPLKSYQLYISKLNPNCDSLFQRPKKNFKLSHVWYDNAPLGHNKIGDLMKDISKEANLSTIYTNHSIRATTSTALHQAGLSSERITAITGHKNNESLKHYISGPSIQQKHESSSILHTYGKKKCTSHQLEIPDINAPSTSTMISSMENKPNNLLVPVSACNNLGNNSDNPLVPVSACNTLNIPTLSGIGSLFAGANIGAGSNININFNAGEYHGNAQN